MHRRGNKEWLRGLDESVRGSAGDYSFLASLAFGLSSVDPHLRQRVARIAFRA